MMKHILASLLLITILYSCKSDQQHKIIKGNFIYYDNAAVLQTDSIVYGVIINSTVEKLNKQVEKFKKEVTDMVPVEVQAIITKKPENEEGWEYRVDIQEILNVFEPSGLNKDVIKLKNE